jgi:hypothetical protein
MGWQDAPLVEKPKWQSAPLVGSEPEETDSDIFSMPALDDTTAYQPLDEIGKNTISDDMGEIVSDIKEVGSDLLALGEVGLTIGTGAVSSITVAAFGAAAMLFGRDPELVTREVEHYSQKGTILPWTDKAQELLEDIAAPLMEIEEGASDLSWALADENPWAATMIKTSLLGIAELALPSKGSLNAMKTGRLLRKHAADMKKLADDLGVDMSQSGLATSIVELAHKMTPAQRAEHMPYLREQLQQASNLAKRNRDALYQQARETRTFLDKESSGEFAQRMRNDLADRGFDIDDMPKVQKRLKELDDMPVDETGTRVNLREWDNVRKRTNKNRSSDPSENLALNKINREMGKFLDAEFDRLALNQGSAISGETSGVTAWKQARGASRYWHEHFNEDKVIANFISKDATPETLTQWLMGATVMGARREAGATIGRMKQVLGKNHEAIRGIRQDFLYEVAAPLLHPDGPNFKTFVRNYELMIERNPTLVKALDLNMGDFKELHDLARLQKRLPPSEVQIRDVIREANQIIARLAVGHEIAKAGLKVNLTRDVLHLFTGVNRVTQKQMFYELAGLKYGDIMLPRGRPLAAEFIAGAALTEISDAQEIIDPLQE